MAKFDHKIHLDTLSIEAHKANPLVMWIVLKELIKAASRHKKEFATYSKCIRHLLKAYRNLPDSEEYAGERELLIRMVEFLIKEKPWPKPWSEVSDDTERRVFLNAIRKGKTNGRAT